MAVDCEPPVELVRACNTHAIALLSCSQNSARAIEQLRTMISKALAPTLLLQDVDGDEFRAADLPLLHVYIQTQLQLAALSEKLSELKPAVEARIGALWSLANIATLIGLVGTVAGLIQTSASALQLTNPASRSVCAIKSAHIFAEDLSP